MDTSDPSIQFDDNGISNHFWDFHRNIRPNWPYAKYGPAESASQLDRLAQTIRLEGKRNEFDCILGLSGGLDSSFMLHRVVRDFGLRPLVLHVDGGWNSETAVRNIQVLVEKLKLDLFTEVIDWRDMRNFQLAMFRSGVPHLDVPQDLAFVSVLYDYASRHGIRHILNGGNVSTECVLMPLEILYWGTDLRHINDLISRFSDEPLTNFPMSSVWRHKFWLHYFQRIRVSKPLNYLNFSKSDAQKELSDEYGWQDYGQKHFESRFTRFFEGYWLPTRFSYDMRRNQLSSLILTGQLTRGKALDILKEPALSDREAKIEAQFIARKLEISEEELWSYHSAPLKYYWDYANSSHFFEAGNVVLGRLRKTRRGGAL